MRRLVFAGFVAMGAAACGGGGGSSVGLITADWSFTTTTGAATNICPVGSTSATVTSTRLDGALNPTSDVFIDIYNCSDNSGVSDYPVGIYDVQLKVTGYDFGTVLQGNDRTVGAVVDITTNEKP